MFLNHRTLHSILLLFLILAAGSFLYKPEAKASQIARAPILIQGNSGFTPANGVTGGTGTVSDPYLIQGWTINLCWNCYSISTGISVSNTTSYFQIVSVNVFDQNQGSNSWGIVLNNVTSGRIDSSSVDVESAFNGPGVIVEGSRNVLVNANNIVAGGCTGMDNCSHYDVIGVYSSSNVTVSGNSIKAYASGPVLDVKGSSNVNILHNTVNTGFEPPLGGASGPANGIMVSTSGNVRISKNSVINSACGESIVIGGSNNLQIFGNNVTVPGSGSCRPYFFGNGIVLQSTTGAMVYHNNLVNNTPQASDDNPGKNRWDNGYPSGGNYWSDYTGVDNCSGPQQNICPSSDGIGDSPYAISGGVYDHYPLMIPYAAVAGVTVPINRTITFQNLTVVITGSLSVGSGSVYGTITIKATNSSGVQLFLKDYNVTSLAFSNNVTRFLLNVAAGPYPLSADITVSQTGGVWSASVIVTRQLDMANHGSVDISDVSVIFRNYGFGLGSNGYNPQADLRGSGTVDIVDVGLISMFYLAPDFT